MNIGTALLDLCAKHDLSALQISFNLNQAEGSRFDATAFWSAPTDTGLACVSALAATPEEALRLTIAKAAETRAAPAVEIPVLELAE